MAPIVKDVSRIKEFRVREGNAFVFVVGETMSEIAGRHLEYIKNNVLNTPSNKLKSLKRRIATNKDWYKIKTRASGQFIFNYYLRENIDFIYNPQRIMVSDNFYSFDVKSKNEVHFAILNSTLTKMSILLNSRNQGSGLRKVQVFEFKKISVVDIERLSSDAINKLEQLGRVLMASSRYVKSPSNVRIKIDEILLQEYNRLSGSRITSSDLMNSYIDISKI